MLTTGFAPTSLETIKVTPGLGLQVQDWEEGRPIVLIPGWSLSDEIFDHQMSELTKTGFRAISISLRGCKKTESPWETYNYYIFADDLLAIANHLDLNAVTLGGHSICGAIAIHYLDFHQGRIVPRLALFGAPAPAWPSETHRPRGSQVPGLGEDIEPLDCDRPFLYDSSGNSAGLAGTLIDPGVATWFLCHGRPHRAVGDNVLQYGNCT